MSIKLWNWEKNWQCEQVFEGHTHYVMQIAFNPKDNNTFASASLDRTVKACRHLPYASEREMANCGCFRCGSSALPPPISPWKGTTRA